MKLKREKDVNIAVEVNGEKFISLEDGIVYQTSNDKEILICVKTKNEDKEIKMRIIKKQKNANS